MDLNESAKGESSKLTEAIEPMKDPVEEMEENNDDDEYVDSDDELIYPTWWTVPEWDVDSFDGLEYHSSDEENEFPDEEHELIWRRFRRQLIENKGFDVEPDVRPMYGYSDFRFVGDLDMPASYGQTYRNYFAEMACLCLQKYNHDKGSIVEFVEVVRGIFTTGSRSKSYITFNAREKPDGPLVEYQAKVWCTIVQGENYPILCRPAPSAKKTSNQN